MRDFAKRGVICEKKFLDEKNFLGKNIARRQNITFKRRVHREGGKEKGDLPR